jgi:hypothetical protein
VVFDAKEHGHFNKTISVFYNGKDSPIKLINKGEMLDTKEKILSIKLTKIMYNEQKL